MYHLVHSSSKFSHSQITTVSFLLIMDEMAICQHVEWDGNKYNGFIDMGTELDDDCLPVLKKTLTLMVVSRGSAFKVSVGYF